MENKKCVHYWILEPPENGEVKGVCKKCGLSSVTRENGTVEYFEIKRDISRAIKAEEILTDNAETWARLFKDRYDNELKKYPDAAEEDVFMELYCEVLQVGGLAFMLRAWIGNLKDIKTDNAQKGAICALKNVIQYLESVDKLTPSSLIQNGKGVVLLI